MTEPRRIRELDELGRRELIASAELCRRIADGRDIARPTFINTLARLDEHVAELRDLAKASTPPGGRVAASSYFERHVAIEARLRRTIGGLTVSRDAVRRQHLLLERDTRALLTVRSEIDVVAARLAVIETNSATETGTRRHDLAVQRLVVDQAIAGLQLATATTRRLELAIDAVLHETVTALRMVALASRSFVRQRVIVDRLRAEVAAMSTLAGEATTVSRSAPASQASPDDLWRSLGVAWHRVERSAAAIENLRRELAS